MGIYNKISKKITLLNLIKYSFIIDVIYIISKIILSNFGIVFRQRLVDLIYINNAILIIIIAIYLKNYLEGKTGIVVAVIIILIGLWNVFFFYAFSQNSESKIYKEGKFLIASCDIFLLESTVEFYDPINIFLMKETTIDGFMYNGAYDYYKYNEDSKEFLEDEYVNLTESIELLGMSPIDAKKKFSKDVFEYLGDHKYDFGDIKIIFNEKEDAANEVLFERDVVKSNGESIIGKDVESVKEGVRRDYKNKYKQGDVELIFEEFIDENNKKNIKIIDEFKNGYFYFIVDENDIIIAIKLSHEEYNE